MRRASAPRSLALVLALSACATTSAPASPVAPSSAPVAEVNAAGPVPEIAVVHRARCGACHVRVEPGTRTRTVMTHALLRHRKRVHLTDSQWAALLDYLAAG